MDCVLKHVVKEVGVGLDKVIESLKLFDFTALLVVEEVKVYFIRVKFLVFHLNLQVSFLLCYFAVSLLQLFLLLLQRADFFIDLFLHHLVQVLLLDVELLHYPSERFLKSVDFFIKLLAHLQLQLVVVLLLTWRRLLFDLLDFLVKFLHHALHGDNFGRATHNIVLLVGVFEDALRAKHLLVVFAEEFNFL